MAVFAARGLLAEFHAFLLQFLAHALQTGSHGFADGLADGGTGFLGALAAERTADGTANARTDASADATSVIESLVHGDTADLARDVAHAAAESLAHGLSFAACDGSADGGSHPLADAFADAGGDVFALGGLVLHGWSSRVLILCRWRLVNRIGRIDRWCVRRRRHIREVLLSLSLSLLRALLECLLVLMHLHQAAGLLLRRFMQGRRHVQLLELLQLLVHLKLLLLLLRLKLLLHGHLLHLLDLQIELLKLHVLHFDEPLHASLHQVHHRLLLLLLRHLLHELLHDQDLLLPHQQHLRLELLLCRELIELPALFEHLLDLHHELLGRIDLRAILLLILTVDGSRVRSFHLGGFLRGIVLRRLRLGSALRLPVRSHGGSSRLGAAFSRLLLGRGLRLWAVADDWRALDLGRCRRFFRLLPARRLLRRLVSMPAHHVLLLGLRLHGF